MFSLNLTGAVTDSEIAGFGSISVDDEQYQAVIRANGQRVEGVSGDFNDTVGSLPTISRGAADSGFQRDLVSENIIDDEFAQDVLLVDFTRS